MLLDVPPNYDSPTLPKSNVTLSLGLETVACHLNTNNPDARLIDTCRSSDVQRP